jgi:hypothetical protein
MKRVLAVLLVALSIMASAATEEVIWKERFPEKGATVLLIAVREYLYMGWPVNKGERFNDTRTYIKVVVTNDSDVPLGVKIWFDAIDDDGNRHQRFGGAAWLNPQRTVTHLVDGVPNGKSVKDFIKTKMEVTRLDGKEAPARQQSQNSPPEGEGRRPSVGLSDILEPAKEGDLNAVQVNVEAGADVNVADKYGYTALMWATRNGHLTIVNYLLVKKANVNAKARDGYTALMFAARRGEPTIIKALLDGGADKSLRQQNGYTALDIAGGSSAAAELRSLLQ